MIKAIMITGSLIGAIFTLEEAVKRFAPPLWQPVCLYLERSVHESIVDELKQADEKIAAMISRAKDLRYCNLRKEIDSIYATGKRDQIIEKKTELLDRIFKLHDHIREKLESIWSSIDHVYFFRHRHKFVDYEDLMREIASEFPDDFLTTQDYKSIEFLELYEKLLQLDTEYQQLPNPLYMEEQIEEISKTISLPNCQAVLQEAKERDESYKSLEDDIHGLASSTRELAWKEINHEPEEICKIAEQPH